MSAVAEAPSDRWRWCEVENKGRRRAGGRYHDRNTHTHSHTHTHVHDMMMATAAERMGVASALLCLVLLLRLSPHLCQGSPTSHSDTKSLVNLGLMVASHVPCRFPYFPIPYGCWCGITVPYPSPYDPVDEFDGACRVHDQCYDDSLAEGCGFMDEYVWLYDWQYVNGEIICEENNEKCQKIICECDKAVAHALANASLALGCPTQNPGCA